MNSSLSTKEKILFGFEIHNMVGVEIGPLASPLVDKEAGDVRYIDRASTDEVKKWYSRVNDPDILDINNIVPIDYVWGDNSLAEATGHSNHFDYCIAAHVIEHVPDLIGWLKEISTILKAGGIAAFSVPDRRFTFDFLRPETTVADLVEAYLLKKRKPSIRHIFDHFSSFAEINIDDAWKSDFDGMSLTPSKGLTEVFEICQDALENDKYIDSHCWVFTSSTFISLLKALNEMNLFDFKICRFFGVEENNHEFVIQLEKLPEDLSISEKQSAFSKSLKLINPHIFSIRFQSNTSGIAQLYYDTGDGFNERESICLNYLKGRDIKLDFTLPPFLINALRFDPAKGPVKTTIHSLDLYLFSEDHISIPLDTFEPGENIKKSHLTRKGYFAKSVRRTNDPYLLINLPDSLKGR